MQYEKFGYEYSKSRRTGCLDNLQLIYYDGDLYWITCSERTLFNPEKFQDGEMFVMGFTLEKKDGYCLTYYTAITYRDILDDIRDNGIGDMVELCFDEEKYNSYRRFSIDASSFSDAVEKIKAKLNHLLVRSQRNESPV